MQDVYSQLQSIIAKFKKQVNARAVILLDCGQGNTLEIADLKTEKVTLGHLTECISDFAENTKKFLCNTHIGDETTPSTVYISSGNRRVFMCKFFVQNKTTPQCFPLYLGLMIKKDLDALPWGRDEERGHPQYVFDCMWETVQKIQSLYAKLLPPSL